jgi:hypothetical protein
MSHPTMDITEVKRLKSVWLYTYKLLSRGEKKEASHQISTLRETLGIEEPLDFRDSLRRIGMALKCAEQLYYVRTRGLEVGVSVLYSGEKAVIRKIHSNGLLHLELEGGRHSTQANPKHCIPEV